MTPYQKAGYNELSLFKARRNHEYRAGTIVWLALDDQTIMPKFSNGEGELFVHLEYIKELPKDEDGFYLWNGGDCPVPEDWVVEVKYDCPRESDWAIRSVASTFAWFPETHVCAFKPISRPDMPAVSGCTVTNEKAIGVTVGGTMAPQCQFSHEAGEQVMKLSNMIFYVAAINAGLMHFDVVPTTLWNFSLAIGLVVITWPLLKIAEALEGEQ